jgi:5-methyltetrahydropteroyltriglutamate--homocysteine methyltransferase
LRNVPEERVRYHFCWGSWHGPHAYDIPFADMVDVMLAVKAKFYSFEAANVRHAHEHRVWERVALPSHKVIMPGVITHSMITAFRTCQLSLPPSVCRSCPPREPGPAGLCSLPCRV